MKRLLCLCLFLPALACAGEPSSATAADDDKFLAALDAFRNGDRQKLGRLAGEIRDGDLLPWLNYYSLRLHFDDTDSATAVQQFLGEHAGSYLAEKLRGDWLKQLGKRGQWAEFAAEYRQMQFPDADITCMAQEQRMAAAADAGVREDARTLWFSLPDLDGSCQRLMTDLRRSGGLSDDDVWRRLRGELETRNLAQARQTLGFLPAAQRPAAHEIDLVASKPLHYLDKLPARFAADRRERELAFFALERLARQDAATAAAALQRIEAKLSEADRGYAWGQLAWAAAWTHRPEALSWYARAGATPLSEDQLAWKARAALRGRDWPALEQAIAQMPPQLAAQPSWLYWRGRALAALQRGDEAEAMYRRIANQPIFYGSLAAEELGLAISVPPLAEPATTDELATVAANPGLRRALALMRLDQRVEGVREWNWTVRGMDDRQLLAAAELARRVDVFDRAISTAERTQAEHDYTLRYPTPFRDKIEAQLRGLSLDPGWVYALMRQESRFVIGARSAAGARGLMQLMPTTARWVAKKIRLVDFHPQGVGDLDTNLTLGTNYLRLTLDAFNDSMVLASAAYNAGPAHVRQWCGEAPMEGAIFIETIPFTETRDYVKNVMSNTIYYAALFEAKPQSIKARLGTITPRRQGDILIDALP
jgi:soluble lytic murein transglycosylase